MRTWHDLYMLFGTASATLIGLLFVAASVAFRTPDPARSPAVRSFYSPTVVHFSCVLIASLIALCPLRSWTVLSVLIAANGIYGLGYAMTVLHRMVRHGLTAKIDLEDQLWYAILPAVAYAIMLGAGMTFLYQTEIACYVLAFAMILLLLIGIRNAWDITIWSVLRPPSEASTPMGRRSDQAEPP